MEFIYKFFWLSGCYAFLYEHGVVCCAEAAPREHGLYDLSDCIAVDDLSVRDDLLAVRDGAGAGRCLSAQSGIRGHRCAQGQTGIRRPDAPGQSLRAQRAGSAGLE